MTRSAGHRADHAAPGGGDGEVPDASLVASLAARKARFLTVVSHELRTPLTSIASFVDRLADEELAADERPLAVGAVRRNTARMLALVDDLMLLGRLETGDLPLARAAVEVPALVHAATDALRGAEPAAEVELAVTDGPPVFGDEALLRLVVYAAAGVVAGQAADHRARLSADPSADGWTITALGRQAEALTEEFLLAGTLAIPDPPARRRSTALWVLLAEAVTERHGGRLVIGYDPAAGAAVTVRLPIRAHTGSG